MLTREESQQRVVEINQWLRQFARTRLNSVIADDRRSIPPHAVIEMGNQGLLGLMGPVEMGGAGLLPGDAMRVIRQLSSIDLSLGLMVGLHNFLASRTLLLNGSKEFLAEFAQGIISGRKIASYSLSEPAAGSDPRRIECTARQTPSGNWILNGKKVWSGVAAWASIAAVFARSFDAAGKDLGITAFALPMDTPGIEQGPEAMTMGLRAVVQNEFVLRNVEVQPKYILGEVGKGLDIGQASMMISRMVCATFGAGAMLRSLQSARRYVSRRTIGTGAMADNAVVSDELTLESIRTHAIQMFLDRNFDALNAGEDLSPMIYLAAKIIGPEQAFITSDRCLQLLGGRGYIESNVVSRMLRDIRIVRIFEGPTEALTAYLGGVAVTKPHELEAILIALHGTDLWQQMAAKIAELNPLIRRDRATRLRGQYAVGQCAAVAIFLAVLRQAATNSASDCASVELFETFFSEALASPFCADPRLDRESMLSLGDDLDDMVGNVDENAGGEDWELDSYLIC